MYTQIPLLHLFPGIRIDSIKNDQSRSMESIQKKVSTSHCHVCVSFPQRVRTSKEVAIDIIKMAIRLYIHVNELIQTTFILNIKIYNSLVSS